MFLGDDDDDGDEFTNNGKNDDGDDDGDDTANEGSALCAMTSAASWLFLFFSCSFRNFLSRFTCLETDLSFRSLSSSCCCGWCLGEGEEGNGEDAAAEGDDESMSL